MSEREDGYYWTKVDGEWEPAFHQGDGDWRIYGGWAEDDWFEEIGPHIPRPDEPEFGALYRDNADWTT